MNSRVKESKLKVLLFDNSPGTAMQFIKRFLDDDEKVFSKLTTTPEETISELKEKYDIFISHLSGDNDGEIASFVKGVYGNEVLTLGVSLGGLSRYGHKINRGLLSDYDEIFDGGCEGIGKAIQEVAEKHGFYLSLTRERLNSL